MPAIVSITSQGQVTIPAAIRRKLGLNRYPKAQVFLRKNQIILSPIANILDLAGALKDKAIKGKNIDQIIQQEEKAAFLAAKKRGEKYGRKKN